MSLRESVRKVNTGTRRTIVFTVGLEQLTYTFARVLGTRIADAGEG